VFALFTVPLSLSHAADDLPATSAEDHAISALPEIGFIGHSKSETIAQDLGAARETCKRVMKTEQERFSVDFLSSPGPRVEIAYGESVLELVHVVGEPKHSSWSAWILIGEVSLSLEARMEKFATFP
jgi:hypothetical protein